MLRIRLARQGSKKRPHYRVVVSDSARGRGGNIVESLGVYDPKRDSRSARIDRERAAYWIAKGAHATETVRSLLSKAGMSPGKTPEQSPPPNRRKGEGPG